MGNEFKDLAKKAKDMTDKQFKEELSGLTSLTEKDIQNMIMTTGISSADLAKVLNEVKAATASNEAAAKAIININKGVESLISVAKLFI